MPPVLGNALAQLALVGAGPGRDDPLEVGQVGTGQPNRIGIVFGHQVDHAVADLYIEGSDFLGTIATQTSPFDHGRSPHPDGGVGGGDDHVAAAEQGGIAGKTATRGDPDQRHQTAQTTEEGEGPGVQTGDGGVVGVAGPTAAALGKQDDGKAQPFDELEHPVLLAMVLLALRPGQHGVVVREDGAGRPSVTELVGADPSDPGHQPVGRCTGYELLDISPSALGGNGQRSVLGEASRIAQIGDVLACGPPTVGVAAVHRVRSAFVGRPVPAAPELGQIGPDDGGVSVRTAGRTGLPATTPSSAPATSMTARPSPAATTRPTSATRSSTTPGAGDRTTCSIFIDSTIPTGAPRSIRSPTVTGTATTVPCTGDSTVNGAPTGGGVPSATAVRARASGRCSARGPPR